MKFDPFLKENDVKRERARVKIREEKHASKLKDEEIAKLLLEMESVRR